jgi:hypothetical protein
MSLSLQEQSLRDFLIEQICFLRLVVEAQDGSAPSLAQESIALAQDSWHDQDIIIIASVGRCPVVVGQSSHAPLSRDGGQVVILNNPSCGRDAVLSPPRLRLKLPWDASCSFSAGLLLLPPQHGVTLFGRCSNGDA